MFDKDALCLQVKRLEILLQRCKETIKNNKERVSQLTADKDSLQMSLEWKEQEITKAKVLLCRCTCSCTCHTLYMYMLVVNLICTA